MDSFEKALAFTLANEGGYANDANDGGGPTNLGVTAGTLAAAYRDGLVPHCDVRRLTREEAAEIYRVRYWEASKAGRMPEPLCILHFDAAVNHGRAGAGKLLQKTLNALGAKVDTDGSVGPATLKALDEVLAGRGISALCAAYCDERERLYRSIVKNNPPQSKFLRGWLNRLQRNRELI